MSAHAQLLRGTATGFDVDRIREDFPILRERVHGKPLVYLDNAATSQKPQAVIDSLVDYYSHYNANVHRAVHLLSARATEACDRTRERVRAFVNAASTDEIIFVRGTTEALNLVAQTHGRQNIRSGDEVLISGLEHHSNIVPWQMLCNEKQAHLRVVPIDDNGVIPLDRFEKALNERTRLVALAHVSNALGTVNPLAKMIELAHRAGVPVVVDGAQAVPHMPVDVQALDADFYAFSGHKLYGPTGVGVLYGKAEQLAALPPYQGGGEMIGQVTLDAITYADPPHRFEAGTPPILEAIGLGAAIDWLSGLDRLAIAEHEHRLYQRVREGLAGANWLKVLGEAPGKGAILAFTVDGAHAHDIAQILDRYGVAVRAGTHCAEPLMRRFGVTSSARASFALYNTEREADFFVDALTKTQAFFA